MLKLLRPLQEYFHTACRAVGIDRAVGMVLVGRGASLIAGPLTLIFIGHFLRPDEQGYYFTFNSVISLNIFFELGLSFVIVQVASHEWAHLQWTPNRLLAGEASRKGRLAAMAKKALKGYAVASVVGCLCILPAGGFFFRHAGHNPGNVAWQLPWVSMVLASALGWYINVLLSVLEGCGKIAEISSMRVVQTIAANIVLWAALIGRLALFASPIYQTAMLTIPAIWLAARYRRFFVDLLKTDTRWISFSWMREVWPFQWKVALSWLSGYFIFQLFNPVLFAFKGPVEAGRMGMTISAIAALQAICFAWVSTKSAPFGALIAKKEFAGLDRVFFRSVAQSTGLFAVGSATAIGCLFFLRWGRFPLAARLLDPLPFGILLMTALMNHIVFCEALYLRAHKKEPFMVTSLVTAVCVSLSTYFLGRAYGSAGIAVGYCAVTLLVGLGGGTYIFVTKRRLWHAEPRTQLTYAAATTGVDGISA